MEALAALTEENATLKQENATLKEQKAALEKKNGELKKSNGVLELLFQQMGGGMTALGNATVHADNQRKSETIQLLRNQVNIEDLKKRFDEDQQKLHVENKSLKDQLKAVQEENELLQKQNHDLQLKVHKLTKSVGDLEAKNQEQEKRVKVLECEKARREELALATDLFSMHVFYAMDGMKHWSQVREQAGNLKADWEDGDITEAQYADDLVGLAKKAQLSPGDFVAWVDLKDERNNGTHTDLCSAKNQKAFLAHIEGCTFSTLHSQQATALQNVIDFLKKQELKRQKK